MSRPYLDQDWNALDHAYGTAEDVPELLANLNSPDQTTRKNALHELFGNIWHQGTVYPATVKAIPQLVALFQSADCADREMVALLLASIADGEGYYSVHSKLEKLRPTYEKILRDRGSSIVEEIARENDYVGAIRGMAIEFMLLIEGYLNSPEPSVRESIASAMMRYAAHFPHYESLLAARVQVEKDEDVRERIESGLTEIREEKAQQAASPNRGPAESPGNSGACGGPPSVS